MEDEKEIDPNGEKPADLPPPTREEFEAQQVLINKYRAGEEKQRKGKAAAKAEAEAEKTKADDALAVNGRFEELAKSQRTTLDAQATELETLRAAQAENAADKLARETNLEARVKGLTPEQKALVEKGGTMADREALAAHFSTTSPEGPPSQNGVRDGIDNSGTDSNAPPVDLNDPTAVMAMSDEDFAAAFGGHASGKKTGLETAYQSFTKK